MTQSTQQSTHDVRPFATTGRPRVAAVLAMLAVTGLLALPIVGQSAGFTPNPALDHPISGNLSRYTCSDATSMQMPDNQCSSGTAGFENWLERVSPDRSGECSDACLRCCETHGGQLYFQRVLNSAICKCAQGIFDLDPAEVLQCLAPDEKATLSQFRSIARKSAGNLHALLSAANWSTDMIRFFERELGVPLRQNHQGNWRLARRRFERDKPETGLDAVNDAVATWMAGTHLFAASILRKGIDICSENIDNVNNWLDEQYRSECRRSCFEHFQPVPTPTTPPPAEEGPSETGHGPEGDDEGRGPGVSDPPSAPPTPPEDDGPCQGIYPGEECFDGSSNNGTACYWTDECECDCEHVTTGGFPTIDCNRCDPLDFFIHTLPNECFLFCDL